MAGLFIGFWLRNAPLVGNPISENIVFKNEPNHFTLLEKCQAILALFDGFQDLHLDWYARVIIVFDAYFTKSSVVYAASLWPFMHVCKL